MNDPLDFATKLPVSDEQAAQGARLTGDDLKAFSQVAKHAVGCGDGAKPAPKAPINEGAHYGGPQAHSPALRAQLALIDKALPLKKISGQDDA